MATNSKKKPNMTDEERSALVKKLQDDIEDFVAQKSIKARNKKREIDTQTTDEIIEELKQHPAFLKEIDYSKPLHPEVEALMQIKYESENPTARAESYKEDGNEQFKLKKYSIAIDNYTEGITSKCPEKELNAILYTNRAAAQYHLGNFRSAFKDCIFARKFKADHFKAILRGAQCSHQMRKYDDAIRWCDSALLIEPESKVLLDLRLESETKRKIGERDERKKAAKERKEDIEEKKLIERIQRCGIKLASLEKSSDGAKPASSMLLNSESYNPTGARVHQDAEGVLRWPLLFIYPEYSETDFISAFCENDCFIDHLNAMFGPGVEPAPWDTDRKYKPHDLEICFENREESKLYSIPLETSLLEALQHKKYTVLGGTPGFIVLVKGSPFRNEFYKRYR